MRKLLAATSVALLMAGCGGGVDLDDPETLDKIIAEAIDDDELWWRGKEGEELRYAPNQQKPYTGWMKWMYKNGPVKWLHQYKDGKYDGPTTLWLSNGQKWVEHTFKDGWVSRESSVSRRHSRRVISVVGKIFRASLVDKNQ